MANAQLFPAETDSPSAATLQRWGEAAVLLGLALALAGMPIAFAPQLYDDFTLAKQVVLLVSALVVTGGLAAGGFASFGSRPLRIALGCWLAMLLLSEVFALDRRGSLLGVYQYRQGFLTQLSYVVLFAGAIQAGSLGKGRFVALFAAPGLLGVLVYTAIQAIGHDPIDWWIDTKDRAIGSIGNANELAAYAVVALVAVGPLLAMRGRARLALVALSAAASTFIVFEAESRSGLVGLMAFAVLFPASWWLAQNPLRQLLPPAVALAAGFVLGALASSLAGGLEGSAARVQSGVTGEDPGGSTRFSLWRGAVEVIKTEPIFGVGPDGLFLSFPVNRPADLGGAYDDYDLVAQSSHNYALDTAANYGLPGLAALAAVVGLAGFTSIRETRRLNLNTSVVRAEPAIWAALGAYGALTLLNPISLAAHALFFVMLGLMAATPRVRPVPASSRRLFGSALMAAPVGAAILVLAVRLPWADYQANQGWTDYDAQRFDQAARHYEDARATMPLERHYAQKVAETWFAASIADPGANLPRAAEAYETLDDRFGMVSNDALSASAVGIAAGEDPAKVNALIERAIALNPHGVAIIEYTDILKRALVDGAIVQYSQKHHWTYIDTRPRP